MATMPKKPRKKRAAALTSKTLPKVNGTDEKTKPEPKVESVAVPAALLLAAETIAAKVPKDSHLHNAVMLHQKDAGVARLVAFDGVRTFIGSFDVRNAPTWLKAGVLIERDDLKARVQMIAKVADSPVVIIAYAKGASTLTMGDPNSSMAFKVGAAGVADFPDYETNIQIKSFTDMADDGERTDRPEWEPVGFSSHHMKDCGDIAKILTAAMPKEEREKDGMTIRIYDRGNTFAPRVFDFSGYPGAMLVIGAMPLVSHQLPLLTAKLLAPAQKGTVAALRAHATRWTEAAAAAETDEQRAACLAKAEGFQQRVAAVIALAPDKLAIGGPAPTAAKLEPPAAEKDKPLTVGEKAAATKRRKAAERAASAVLH